MEVSAQLHASTALLPGKEPPGTHWIGGWVDPRAGLDDVERRKIHPLLGLELQSLGRPARSKSLCRLCYPGSFSVYDGKTIRHNEAPVAYAVIKAVYSSTTCPQGYFRQNIQHVPRGKVNILGGHNIGHSKHKSVYVHLYLGNRSE
jgi:hypothetical protein